MLYWIFENFKSILIIKSQNNFKIEIFKIDYEFSENDNFQLELINDLIYWEFDSK